jgi:anti-anti-sigma regulatory factor
MPKKTSAAFKLSLAGDWSIGGVADQLPVLTHTLASLLQSQDPKKKHASEAQSNPEIDLAKVTALDACGCQLLVCFHRTLQQYGISLRLSNIPDGFMTKIRQLGFGRDFNLSH